MFPSGVRVGISVFGRFVYLAVSQRQSSGPFPFLAHVSVLESERLLPSSVPL